MKCNKDARGGGGLGKEHSVLTSSYVTVRNALVVLRLTSSPFTKEEHRRNMSHRAQQGTSRTLAAPTLTRKWQQ